MQFVKNFTNSSRKKLYLRVSKRKKGCIFAEVSELLLVYAQNILKRGFMKNYFTQNRITVCLFILANLLSYSNASGACYYSQNGITTLKSVNGYPWSYWNTKRDGSGTQPPYNLSDSDSLVIQSQHTVAVINTNSMANLIVEGTLTLGLQGYWNASILQIDRLLHVTSTGKIEPCNTTMGHSIILNGRAYFGIYFNDTYFINDGVVQCLAPNGNSINFSINISSLFTGADVYFEGTNPINFNSIDHRMGKLFVNNEINVQRNFTSNGAVHLGSGTHQFKGNIEILPSGKVFPQNSTIVLNGHVPQATYSNVLDCNNLIINNTSETTPQVVFNTNVTISGHLELQNGIIVTPPSPGNPRFLLTETATASEGHSKSYIDGPVGKAGDTDFIFPVGKNGKYKKIEISNITESGTFTAEYISMPPANSTQMTGDIEHIDPNEYWEVLKKAGSGNLRASVRLFWEDMEKDGITNLETLTMTYYRANLWRKLNTTINSSGAKGSSGYITATGMGIFGSIAFASTIATDNPLPVTLTDFTGKATTEKTAQLQWTTASEFNNNRFEIERSSNGINFEYVAAIASKGDAATEQNYNFIDIAPFAGNTYYRLKQFDNDGTETSFNIVCVYIENTFEINTCVYPNPVTNHNCYMRFNHAVNQKVTLELYNPSGVLTNKEEFNTNGIKDLNISNITATLNSGIYYLRITTEGYSKIHKLIVK